jgi:hypothetical protein
VSRRSFAAALSVMLALVLGCGVPDEGLQVIDREELPESLRSTSTTSTTVAEAGEVELAAVYWIRSQRLIRESVLFESGPDAGRLLAVLERGPARDGEGAPRSAISGTDAIVDARQRGDTVVVELDEISGPDQVLAIGQVVMTLTSLAGVESVRFERDGVVVEVPLPDGTLVRRALTGSDYSSLLASS